MLIKWAFHAFFKQAKNKDDVLLNVFLIAAKFPTEELVKKKKKELSIYQ